MVAYRVGRLDLTSFERVLLSANYGLEDCGCIARVISDSCDFFLQKNTS